MYCFWHLYFLVSLWYFYFWIQMICIPTKWIFRYTYIYFLVHSNPRVHPRVPHLLNIKQPVAEDLYFTRISKGRIWVTGLNLPYNFTSERFSLIFMPLSSELDAQNICRVYFRTSQEIRICLHRHIPFIRLKAICLYLNTDKVIVP